MSELQKGPSQNARGCQTCYESSVTTKILMRLAISSPIELTVSPACYKAIVEEDIPCLQSLAFKSMIDRKLEADRAHPTTCAWILKHSHFITWQKSTRGLLWIKGHPGTGKSTMMAFIHRRLTSEHTKTARIDFFFTRRGEELQRSPLGMFRSLLHQLYRQSLIARELIYQAFDEKRRNFGGHGTEWDWQTHELKQLLTSVVKKVARKREITIFVDALDEAVDESDNKVAEQLVEYFHTLNDLPVDEGFVGGIKICISCRHYPVVGSLGPGASIVMEDENRRDLWQFVHDRLSSEVAHWYSEPPDVGQRLVNTIVDKAAGVFLWAALRVPKIVKSLNDGSVSIQKISMVVEGESKELFALYETIFANDVPETQRANALLFLQWVCFAQRPLTLAELRFAIASDEDEAWSGACFEDSADFVESDTRMARLTKSLSGGLAEVKSSEKITTVQFVHETVNDFLRSRGLKFIAILSITERKMYSHNVVGRSESRLSNSCLNYIMKRQIEEMTGEWLDGGDTQPIFLDYATRHWAGHARKAEERGVQQTHIISLFDSSPELLELWIKVYKRLDKQSFQRPLRDSTLLHIAAASNLYSVVHALLKSGASVQKRDEFGNTALHLAVFYGYENITTLLLDYNAGIEVKTKSYSTPLELAAANGHEGLVKLLLKRGADVNQETEYEGSALQAACAKGNFSLVKILLGNGADLNARGGTNFTTHGSVTALQAAVYAENGKLVKFLLQKGADVHIQGGYYGNALQIAAYRGHTDIIDMLLEVGADINAQGGYWGNALQAAGAYYGRLDLIKYFLQRGAFINAEGGRFGTVLQAVASHPDHEKIIQYLIDEGADVNAQGGEFGNPLLAAISAGTEESLRILLNNGARMDVQGGQHGNVLQAAVWSSNKELVKMFLDQGIDVNIRGGEFGTALQAAMMRSQAIAELLLDYGADVNATGGTHHNALNAAIFFNRADHVRLLLNRGAEVNSIKGGHACALQRAAKRGRLEIVQTLLCHGADINLMSGLCSSPLQAAASEGHQAIVELLLDSGADIDLHTSTFGSALQTAALHGHKKIVELLLERGADADLESGVYGNALQVAKGNKSITRLLLAHGAKTRDSIEVSDLLKDLNN
ncbi:ankyrin repeat-containing domain protein [Tricladium varicosporioides]|nr:ankyrin repeat-containing domain protein [Hymenoscyphus varicosporioides]